MPTLGIVKTTAENTNAMDLSYTLTQLATRNPGRSEADIQAGVRDVLLYGGFDLGQAQVKLESPTEEGGRIDVAVGAVLVECKRDLRSSSALAKAEEQLGDYLNSASADGGVHPGLLTDGAIWRLYRFSGGELEYVDGLQLKANAIDERAFRWWLGAVLATQQRVLPTATAIEERLGAGSPSFRLIRSALSECWERGRGHPEVLLKRALWARLLRTALGSQFDDNDELFGDHTYLVLLAVLIGHAVAGFDITQDPPGVLVSGQRFVEAGLLGVGEAGFFDWVLDEPTGADVVNELTRRLASFDWNNVDHDVLKALYHSVISPEVRHRLGEYYTPDWLANSMVAEAVTEPLHQRVLDPACGSGTFLFHAVRRYLDAAAAEHLDVGRALDLVTAQVFGVDLHPVAVALAQVTYLLAIGRDRLGMRSSSLAIPVYLGDSMRWEAADESMFNPAGEIVLDTSEGFGLELRFPRAVVADVGRFDDLVNELVTRACSRKPGGPRPSVEGLLTRFGITDAGDRQTLRGTYNVLCGLHDDGKDHVWGYYVRNQSRPSWLARPENRVDVLVGNPPWLAYRFMEPAMQRVYARRARERGLWHGGARGRTTQQELSAFFVVRCVELYLRQGGRFTFVMPRATLSRQTYEGFRAGLYDSRPEPSFVSFESPWDLGLVDPEPFPVPAAVVFGRRVIEEEAAPLPETTVVWSGDAPAHGTCVDELQKLPGSVKPVSGDEQGSSYKSRFRDGAILYPRMLIMVERAVASPLGVPQGRFAVTSRKSRQDKPPWRDLPPLYGGIESVFLRPAYLGESIVPFRAMQPGMAVVPHDGTRLLSGADDRIDRYPGLAAWWRRAEASWMDHRSSEKRTLLEQLDYMRQLSAQIPSAPLRVVYTASGSQLAAALIEDRRAVIEHKLYWASVVSREEGLYLLAILNAPDLNVFVRPFQSVGAFGPRDFDKYLWHAPIPPFDPNLALHRHLVEISERASRLVSQVEFPPNERFQASRRRVRKALLKWGLSIEMDAALAELLGTTVPAASVTAHIGVGK